VFVSHFANGEASTPCGIYQFLASLFHRAPSDFTWSFSLKGTFSGILLVVFIFSQP